MLNPLTVALVSPLILLINTRATASPLNTTNLLRVDYPCWPGPASSLIFKDCFDAIKNQLGFPHDPDVAMTFSTKPDAMILLPYEKHSTVGNCAIVLGMRDDTLRTEVEKWHSIKAAALGVALSCIPKPPHLGGYAWVGREGNLLMSIIGMKDGRGVERREEEDDDELGEDLTS